MNNVIIYNYFTSLSTPYVFEVEYLFYILLLFICLYVFSIIFIKFPYLSIILIFLTGAVEHELSDSTLFYVPDIYLKGISLRYFDPVIFGLLIAIVSKLIINNNRLKLFLFYKYPLWTILILWLLIRVIISIPNQGIVNSIGEFRTYYHYLLLIPYIVIYFDNPLKQQTLLKLLVILSLSLLLITILRASIEYKFLLNLATDTRWIRSRANIALIFGVTALFFIYKYKIIKINKTLYFVVIFLVITITLINSHRAVWLSLIILIIYLFIRREIEIRHVYNGFLFLSVVVITLLIVFSLSDYSLFEYLQNRIKPFTTDYQDDGTSRWRSILWLQAITDIMSNPVQGIGFGNHFQMIDGQGNLVTTHLHNQFLTIAFHSGVTGLMLYILFIITTFMKFKKILKMNLIANESKVILLVAITAIVTSQIYLIANAYEIFSMLFIGLGISVSLNINKPFGYLRIKEL